MSTAAAPSVFFARLASAILIAAGLAVVALALSLVFNISPFASENPPEEDAAVYQDGPGTLSTPGLTEAEKAMVPPNVAPVEPPAYSEGAPAAPRDEASPGIPAAPTPAPAPSAPPMELKGSLPTTMPTVSISPSDEPRDGN